MTMGCLNLEHAQFRISARKPIDHRRPAKPAADGAVRHPRAGTFLANPVTELGSLSGDYGSGSSAVSALGRPGGAPDPNREGTEFYEQRQNHNGGAIRRRVKALGPTAQTSGNGARGRSSQRVGLPFAGSVGGGRTIRPKDDETDAGGRAPFTRGDDRGRLDDAKEFRKQRLSRGRLLCGRLAEKPSAAHGLCVADSGTHGREQRRHGTAREASRHQSALEVTVFSRVRRGHYRRTHPARYIA